MRRIDLDPDLFRCETCDQETQAERNCNGQNPGAYMLAYGRSIFDRCPISEISALSWEMARLHRATKEIPGMGIRAALGSFPTRWLIDALLMLSEEEAAIRAIWRATDGPQHDE